MANIVSNNAESKLVGTLSAEAATFAVTAGDGAKFPMPVVGESFQVTLTRLDGGVAQREIMTCTSRAGDVFTVARAQEGTLPLTFAAGDDVRCAVTAKVINDKFDKSGGDIAGPVNIGGAVDIGGAVNIAGPVNHNDQLVSGALMVDWADKVKVLAPGVNTIDYRDGKYQVWQPAAGAQTLTITNWPPTGSHGELWIEGVNLGLSTITTSVALDYLKSDGTYASTTSMNTNQGATLRTAGIDNVLIWGREGAPKRAKVAR